ncbi:DUF4097 family beta strand repeat-containing protein [Paenibacillus gansuensis]|uniref:DUF4097 family beta strand repeat-containing protein n=1 Tax=Paenibacillus gansuensis TaxID=306542 RepID=A0ABW5PLA9_9BACL
MSFRKKRTVLLSSVVILFVLMILDASIRKEEMLEMFSEQFVNVQRTEAHEQTLHGETAEEQRQVEMDRQGIEEVLLTGIGVNMSIQRAGGEKIRLEYNVKVSGSSKEKLAAELNRITVQAETKDGKLMFRALSAGKPIHSDWVFMEYTLYLPDSLSLRVENEGGAVRVQAARGDVKVKLARGMLEILDVEGNISVESSLSNIYVADIVGNLDLNSHNGQTNAEQIQGKVHLQNQYDQTRIRKIQGGVTGTTLAGSIQVEEISGPVALQGRETAIQAANVLGDLQLLAKTGEIRLLIPEKEGYRLDAAATNGRILTHLPLPMVTDRDGEYTERIKGIIGEGAWKADVKADSADIIIQHK